MILDGRRCKVIVEVIIINEFSTLIILLTVEMVIVGEFSKRIVLSLLGLCFVQLCLIALSFLLQAPRA